MNLIVPGILYLRSLDYVKERKQEFRYRFWILPSFLLQGLRLFYQYSTCGEWNFDLPLIGDKHKWTFSKLDLQAYAFVFMADILGIEQVKLAEMYINDKPLYTKLLEHMQKIRTNYPHYYGSPNKTLEDGVLKLECVI